MKQALLHRHLDEAVSRIHRGQRNVDHQRRAVSDQEARRTPAGGPDMGTQLYLPAGWARQLESRLDPIERLAELERDRIQAKGDIRELLDRLAEKHRRNRRSDTGLNLQCRSMPSEAESLALQLVCALYAVTDGKAQEWRTLEKLDGTTAEAITFAVARGWVIVEAGHSICLTDAGQRLLDRRAG